MTSATGGRVSQLRSQQRALRYDIVEWMGNPWIFFGLFIVGGLVNRVLGPMPLWLTLPVAALILFGMWRAGKRSWARRQRAS